MLNFRITTLFMANSKLPQNNKTRMCRIGTQSCFCLTNSLAKSNSPEDFRGVFVAHLHQTVPFSGLRMGFEEFERDLRDLVGVRLDGHVAAALDGDVRGALRKCIAQALLQLCVEHPHEGDTLVNL